MIIKRKISLVAAAVMAAALAPATIVPAQAGTKDDIRDLQARMNHVEQGLSAQGAAAVRISELEREIQTLTGLVEELTYRLEISNQRLNAVSAALSGDGGQPVAGFADPAATGAAAPAARGPVNLAAGDPIADPIEQPSSAPANDAAPAVGGGDVALPLDPDAAFMYASGFLLQGDYQRAKSAFQLYVDAFPNHSRTADAQFRLGEIHLALGENAAAADIFIGHIRNYPNDERAAEAYLKLGTAFSRLDKPSEACTVFKTMKTKFPTAPAAVTQRADIEMSRISCQ